MPRLPALGDRHAQLTLAAAVVAAVAVAFGASPHPRITPDSASYLTGAEQLARHGRFETCTGPLTLFAPGYSATIGPLVALGLEAPDAARVVNVLVTLALVFAAGFLARSIGLGGRVSVVVAISVAASYATLRDGALVWSDPLFCAILAWLLVLALGSGQGLDVRLSARLMGVVLVSWALLLTRHSGVFLLPAVLLAGWLGSQRSTHRGTRVALLGVALVAAPVAWWARNVGIDGSPFGRRSGSRFTVLDVLDQFPDGLSSLALPTALPLALRLVVTIPFVVAAALAWRRTARTVPLRPAVAVLTTAVVVYTAAVTLAATRTVVDPIDTRLLSPILVPAAVLVAVGVSSPRTRLERSLRGYALVVVAAMTLLAPAVAWGSHGAERSLATIPDDVSCADWPAQYSPESVEALVRNGG